MLPYKSLIKLDENSSVSKYLQISNELTKRISAGIIQSGTRLPGTRRMGKYLEINRHTIAKAYQELEAQGWVDIIPHKGAFVIEGLKETKKLNMMTRTHTLATAPYQLNSELDFLWDNIKEERGRPRFRYYLNDGHPDVRLAPTQDLYRHLRSIMNSSYSKKLLGYTQQYIGESLLRQELTKYLQETRSINISEEQIMITRGSLMAFFLLFKSILRKGDKVIVAEIGYNEAYQSIRIVGGELVRVSIDQNGINVDQIENILAVEPKIKAIFIVPHHQYPTTVTLSASRRHKLLWLCDLYKIAIIEDDYDYDFHYNSSPILPLATTDVNGSIVYVGSLSKTLLPSLRLGYIVAPRSTISALSKLGTYIDSHGNTAMERAIAQLFRDGQMKRHLRKALRTYHHRRDSFCRLLNIHLSPWISFKIPEGGMAVWALLKDDRSIIECSQIAATQKVYINDGSSFNSEAKSLNGFRLGFASLNDEEAEEMVLAIKEVFEKMK